MKCFFQRGDIFYISHSHIYNKLCLLGVFLYLTSLPFKFGGMSLPVATATVKSNFEASSGAVQALASHIVDPSPDRPFLEWRTTKRQFEKHLATVKISKTGMRASLKPTCSGSPNPTNISSSGAKPPETGFLCTPPPLPLKHCCPPLNSEMPSTCTPRSS